MTNTVRTAEDDEHRSEAKIDYALGLALANSPALCARLIRHLRWPAAGADKTAIVRANQRHGTADSAGESDLIISLPNGGVVLCENKFRAQFQPDQGERYQERAQALVRSGVPHATTLLCAPKGYLVEKAGTPQSRAFPRQLSVEQWLDWLGEIADPTNDEATAIRLLNQVVVDWNSGAFQGEKGIWLPAYTGLNDFFASSDDGWYVQGNPGDWIHIHHESCRVAKFHYRNKDRAVSLEVRKKRTALPQAAQDDARRRGWPISGKGGTVVHRRVRVSALGPDDAPANSDFVEIKRGLEELRSWWLAWSEGAL